MSEGGAKVRYAVVGLGWIAQAAMLPAFANATDNSELVALVSGDEEKLRGVGDQYGIAAQRRYTYAQYEDCLRSGAVDAVYIALPDPLHREYTERAAGLGVHVLCEKPMAVTAADCQAMIEAAAGKVKLMIAYRLHFDEANMQAVATTNGGPIGEARIFASTFTQQVRGDNARLSAAMGDGSLYDIGLYCINAARYLFRAEPTEVLAITSSDDSPRWGAVEEMSGAMMRFPGGRLAQFTCSFGAAFTASYQIIGTRGDLRVNPAYGGGASTHYLTVGGQTTEHTYPDHDHFGPQLRYFSDCILHDHEPEPSGIEGMIDVQIVEAMYQSALQRRPVELHLPTPPARPDLRQTSSPPPVQAPRLINAKAPSFEPK